LSKITDFNNLTSSGRMATLSNTGIVEICALLGYYAALNGNPLPMFRGNVSVPSSRVKKSKKSADLINIAVEA
jgi:hypothetical protein